MSGFDLLQSLPFWFLLAVLLTVIFTELIKKVDKKNRLKGYKVWIPLLLSIFFSFLLFKGAFFNPNECFFWCAAIFGLSVFFYEAIIKKMKGFWEDEKVA